jgi:futalosine hydrolase
MNGPTCLLVAATAKEIAPFLTHFRDSGNPMPVDILITGVGLTATSYALTKQIQIKRPHCIIQAGVAGCFDKNIPPGSVVVVKQDTIADLGVVNNRKLETMFSLGLAKANTTPFKKGWLVNSNTNLVKISGLKPVRAISVNHISTSRQILELYRDNFNPVVESMEGAALHYVAIMEKIPFLQLRAVSNYIGERNKARWRLREAIGALNEELLKITERLFAGN